MEVVVTTEAVRRAMLQSNCHHQQTNTQFFLQARRTSCRPTNSVGARKDWFTETWSKYPLTGFPLELSIGAGVKNNQIDGATRWSKKF